MKNFRVTISDGLKGNFPDKEMQKNLEDLPNEKFATAMFGNNRLYPEYVETTDISTENIYDRCALSVACGVLSCKTESELIIANLLVQAFTGKTIDKLISDTKKM